MTTKSTKPEPYILWDKGAHDLFSDYVDLMPGEVAVWGYVETFIEYPGMLYVSEVFLVPQEATAAGVDFVKDGLPFAIDKAIQEDKLDKLRFCAHSHGTFTAHWSTTDESMIQTIGASGAPWLVSAIFNKAGAKTGRLDVFTTTEFGKIQHTFGDLDIIRERDHDDELVMISDLERLVKEPVKKPAVVKTTTYSKGVPTKKEAAAALTSEIEKTLDDDFIEDMSFEDINALSRVRGWAFIDDSIGVRWYYDDDGQVTGCADIPADYAGEDAEWSMRELGMGRYA